MTRLPNAYAHEIDMQQCFETGREDARAGKPMDKYLHIWPHDERMAYRQGYYSDLGNPDACWEAAQ